MTQFRGSGTPAHRADAVRHNLAVGLHAVTEINQTIRYADTKSAALAGIQALAVTVLVALWMPKTSSVQLTLHDRIRGGVRRDDQFGGRADV
jgi:hypothetical protein